MKLLALIGAFKGGAFVFQSFLYTALIGAVIALGIVLFRKGVLKSILYYTSSRRHGIRLPGGISRGSLTATYPYGVAIAAGTILCMAVESLGWL